MVDPCSADDLCPRVVQNSALPKLYGALLDSPIRTPASEVYGNSRDSDASGSSCTESHGRVIWRSGQGNGNGAHVCPCQYYLYETGGISQDRLDFEADRGCRSGISTPVLRGIWSDGRLRIVRTEDKSKSKLSIHLRGSCNHKRENPKWLLRKSWNNAPCAFLFFIILFMSSTLTLSPRVVLTQATTSAQLDLNLGILVGESCDPEFKVNASASVDSAIAAFYDTVNASDPTAASSGLKVTALTYPYCDTKQVVANLDLILSNDTVQTVLALASYDVHVSFQPLAELYEKAYVALNVFLPTASFDQSASLFPSFSQMAAMLAEILDRYSWGSVFLVQTKLNRWDNFANTLFFKLVSLEFQVTLGDILQPSTDRASALSLLRQVDSSHKGRFKA
ncbi:hypothetical protein EGW08_006807 [Elysia chlorotica]|uniref:Uncharacterized protein n=1 Tax=Elysia chlorotica TaxID=188477 RepID=A0A3S1A8K8_ELYCH|nr:hypothetical protein EGW08_006807 [Elysia chlorotica]